MADLLNINTPVTPKNYDYAGKTAQQPQGDRVFNLADMSKIQKTNERTEEFTNRDTKEGSSLSVQVSVAKNPTAAINVLRSIVDSEAMAALSDGGSADILNKVTEFATEVMLSPSNVAADLVNQEKEATVFSGGIWSELKNMLISSASSDMTHAIVAFAHAVTDASSRDGILTSISSGLAFLSGETAQSRDIAAALLQTANTLTAENFTEMKETVLSLLDTLKGSLLLSDETKNLIPMITYNLSRFNGSQTAVGESFNAILDMTDTAEQADALRAMFMNYIDGADIPDDIKLASLKCLTEGSASPLSSLTLLAEKIGAALNSGTADVSSDKLAALLGHINSADGENALNDTLALMLDNSMKGSLSSIIKSYSSTGNISALLDRLSIIINSVDNFEAKQLIAAKVNDILSQMTVSGSDISLATDSITAQQSLILLSKELGSALDGSLSGISSAKLSKMLSGIDTQSGAASVRNVLTMLLPENTKNSVNLLMRSFNSDNDLNMLIDNLSMVMNSVQNTEKKIIIAQSLNEILGNLAQTNGINYKPPTSMANMLDFLSKNLNDPSLKALSEMSRTDIMQGLLTSPGVFTPLLHYLVPINSDGVKAYGELWVDPDAEQKNGSGKANRMFLCFEIEGTGYFELELETQDKNLQVQLYCPPGTENIFRPLESSIPKLISANGYSTAGARVAPLARRRDLSQVFPKIRDKRSGLNVKI